MIAKKRHPSLSGLPVLRHQSRNSALGNLESEFQQLTVDARGSPDRIGGSHGSDQPANLEIHSRAARPFRLGQSPPVAFESPVLPSDHRVWLNEFERDRQFFQSFFNAIQNNRSRSCNRGRFFSRM